MAVPLPAAFYARSSLELAPALLGLHLVRDTVEGRSGGLIVETEAYGGPADQASHARFGLTRRNAAMFGPPGHAYVYLVYGMHLCLNVVAETDGVAGAVLIRAVRPLVGLDLMRARRGRPRDAVALLAAGPARVCQALAVDRTLDGHDLTRGHALWLEDPGQAAREGPALDVEVGPRVGVAYARDGWAEQAWRFGLRGDASLSRPFGRPAPGQGR